MKIDMENQNANQWKSFSSRVLTYLFGQKEKYGTFEDNVLIFYKKSGKVDYIAKSGFGYSTVFRRNTSEYKLLKFLVGHQGKTYAARELTGCLKEIRQSVASDPKGVLRVRHVTQSIRRKLGVSPSPKYLSKSLPKRAREQLQKNGFESDDPFIIEGNRFGLKCNVKLVDG